MTVARTDPSLSYSPVLRTRQRDLDGRHRWLIAAAGVVMQMALGSIYAWSVFQKPLEHEYGWSGSQVTATFGITIFTLGVAAYFGGLWMSRVGPRTVGIVAAILNGLGVSLAGLSSHGIWVLYLTYGLLSGIGLGLGYIVPVATLVKWFPDRRGLITGIAVTGFGIASLITAPVATRLIGAVGPLSTFVFLGVAYLVVGVLAALPMENPPEGYKPAGWEMPPQLMRQCSVGNFTLREALAQWQWYALWAMLFLNVLAGIAVLSQAASIAEDVGGTGAGTAAGLVGIIAVANGVGRPLWSWLSDYIGRRTVFLSMFALQAALFAALAQVHTFALLAALCFVVLLCHGGGFATMPAFVTDYFGAKWVGQVYGLLLTAWGSAAVVGPQIFARVRESTGHYTLGFTILAGLMLLATVIPLVIRPPACVPRSGVDRSMVAGPVPAPTGT